MMLLRKELWLYENHITFVLFNCLMKWHETNDTILLFTWNKQHSERSLIV